jgi:CxxC motif-containing protein
MKVMISDDRQVIGVDGNNCPRGEKYAKQECTMPLRMITAVIPVENFDTPLSVKTANPIPKKLIPNVMEELKKARVNIPIQIGQVILSDVCGTGIPVIATRPLP